MRALPVAVALGAAAPAHAGSIVYSHGGDQMQLWVAGDDGRGARPFVDNVPLGMSTLREPARRVSARAR